MSAVRAKYVLIVVALLSASSFAQDLATVTAETAPLHSQSSMKSGIVGSLDRGHRIAVDWMISDSQGNWCLVREPDKEATLGYVLCDQLTQQGLPQISKATSAGSSADSWGNSQNDPDQMEHNAIIFWSAQLGLTDQQRNKVLRLLESSGLVAARRDLEQTYRSYGISDQSSLMKRVAQYEQDPVHDSFGTVVEPKIRSGAEQYKAFWIAFWSILTPAQREVAPSVRSFFLGYLASQSYPESAFSSSALINVRGGRRTR
jgi:hypothetical protein